MSKFGTIFESVMQVEAAPMEAPEGWSAYKNGSWTKDKDAMEALEKHYKDARAAYDGLVAEIDEAIKEKKAATTEEALAKAEEKLVKLRAKVGPYAKDVERTLGAMGGKRFWDLREAAELPPIPERILKVQGLIVKHTQAGEKYAAKIEELKKAYEKYQKSLSDGDRADVVKLTDELDVLDNDLQAAWTELNDAKKAASLGK